MGALTMAETGTIRRLRPLGLLLGLRLSSQVINTLLGQRDCCSSGLSSHMGIFDLFRKNTGEAKPRTVSPRELARLTRVVGNKMSANYDRLDAIHDLGALANAEGATALLKRFEFTMEPSITDQDEKEATVVGIAAAGAAALAPIRNFCIRAESLIWPLKVLRQLVPEEEMASELLTLLDQFDTEYVRNSEPKIQLIGLLGEHHTHEVREAVEPFLMDVNEGVRFTACGTIFSISEQASTESLVDALGEEESLRVKNRIARGLAQQGWRLESEWEIRCQEALPPGFCVRELQVTVGQ